MLIARDLLQKALENFPRWMDVRKRHYSSNGGQLLTAMSEEVRDVQNEINQYVKEFFLPYYEDKTEDIYDFLYQGNIGEFKIDEIQIHYPHAFVLTDSLSEFYSNKKTILYQNGFLLARKDHKKIEYRINGYDMEVYLEKINVWNVYDEFAAFIGIARYEDETNKELFKRIEHTSRKVINSSYDGLKEAIITSLTNIVPDINYDDIKLERPTAKNLSKQYDAFKTVLEKLIDINKDIVRTKSWDIDKWFNNFKETSYIPHVWDILLDEYINGIGDNDDLKAILIDTNTLTNVDLTFYQKSQSILSYYMKNRNLEHSLSLSVYKYKNSFNTFNAMYKVTASEAINLSEMGMDYGHDENDEDHLHSSLPSINVNIYESSYGNNVVKLSDIVKTINNVDVVKTGTTVTGRFYRARFYPSSKYDTINISRFRMIDENGVPMLRPDGSETNFMIQKENFIIKDGMLTYQTPAKIISDKSGMLESKNVVKTLSGISVDNISSPAEFSVDISGLNNEEMKVFYECNRSNIPMTKIEMNNFFLRDSDGAFVADNTGSERSLYIKIKSNDFSMNVLKGKAIVVVIADGMPVVNSIVGQGLFETRRFINAKNFEILITETGNEKLEIQELMYSDFDIDVSAKSGTVANGLTDNVFILPNPINNVLLFSIVTRTQHAPIISKIFIGKPLENVYYESDLFEGDSYSFLDIECNCNIELYESAVPFPECNKYDPNQLVHEDYNTDDIFISKSDSSYITLNLDNYSEIGNIDANGNEVEIKEYGKMKEYKIILASGQSLSTINIIGYYNKLIATNEILSLIKNTVPDFRYPSYDDNGNWVYGHKVYISKPFKGFVVEDYLGKQSKVLLTANSFNVHSNAKISKIVFTDMPDFIQGAFIYGDSVYYGESFEGEFTSFYLYPKQSKEYVAINEKVLFQKETNDIDIINTFNNGYEINKLMSYTVEPLANGFDIEFDNGLTMTIGKRSLNIKLLNEPDYNIIRKTVVDNITLDTLIDLKESYKIDEYESIELSQYIIEDTNDYKIIYKHNQLDPNYIRGEYFNITSDGITKLKYSNIVSISYVSYNQDDKSSLISSKLYVADLKKGILVWDKSMTTSNEKVYIEYIIQKPVSIEFNIDYLYNKIQYPIDAYKKINKFEIKNLEDGYKIDLTQPIVGDTALADEIKNAYLSSDRVYVECINPGFKGTKLNDVITINKVAENNTLAIRAGWYYMFGKEYYLFASDKSEEVLEDEYVLYQEIQKIDDQLVLHKKSSNKVLNSKMILGTLGNVFNIDDFNNIENFTGVSRTNSVTACDNYNFWNNLGMNMRLADGFNGLGFNFSTNKDFGYAYLEITKYLYDLSTISFYCLGGIKAYIGVSVLPKSLVSTDAVNIKEMYEVTKTDNDIKSYTIRKNAERKYYLVIRGEGIIDDIMISEGDKANIHNHTKNITSLKMNIKESISKGVTTRLLVDSEKGHKNNNAEMDSRGYIVPASTMDWNTTRIKRYSSMYDWTNSCSLENIHIEMLDDISCIAKTDSIPGKIRTFPIYVGDPRTINNVSFKINDISLKETTGIYASLYQSSTQRSTPLKCNMQSLSSSLVNYTNDLIYPYVHVAVDMPINKVIDNIEIYVEYKSTDSNAPVVTIANAGSFISKVFDTKNSSRYRLKDIGIEDIQGSIKIYIRGSRERSNSNVWTDWKEVIIEDKSVSNNIVFDNYRYFQFKVDVKGVDSKIKINYLDLEVIE